MTKDRRPTVAMVTDSVYPFIRGGKEIRYHQIITRLSRDADVHVYTRKQWSGDRVRDADGAQFHAICRGTGLYRHGRRSLWEAILFGIASSRLALARFDALEADHIPYTPLFVLRAVCTLRRKRFVVTWHEVWGRQAWRDYLGGVMGELAWLVERSAMLLPDRIVAASEETACRLKPYVRRSTVIEAAPHGLDLDLIRATPAHPCRRDLVFVGRLLSHKHVDLLVEAISILRAEGTPLTCRIIGNGPELSRLRRQAEARGVDDLVEFLGDVVDEADVYELLKAGDLFVFPSVREGFGAAVLEAIACGLPVITTSHPDNLSRLLVERTGRGITCDPTADAIADAIMKARQDPCLSVLSGSTADAQLDAWVEQYGWERLVDVVWSAFGLRRAVEPD